MEATFLRLTRGGISLLMSANKVHKDSLSGSQYQAKRRRKTRSLVENLSTDLPSTYKGLMKKPTPGSKQEKWQPMELLMIKGKTLKDQENPLGTITEDRNEGIGSPHTEDLTTNFSPTCPKAQERSSPQKRQLEASNSLLDESYKQNKFEGPTSEGKEITFPSGGSNSSAPVLIKAKIFGREVNQVHMDGGSSCKVIYEYCFMKLKPSIRASKVDSKVPLIGFPGEKSWSIGKIPLEIMIGDPPLTRKETLNFLIVKSDSPYNMLLGRTAIQKMGIVVSTIHGAIKFHTTEGIGIVF
ncbi:reverse transcriptase domain-containing protein [Tanacetum coccineum]